VSRAAVGPAKGRLTLSPIGLDIVLAASQVPHGIRLSDLATVIGSPVSSVQTALRILMGNGLVRRQGGSAPRYGLAAAHPAHEQLVALATVLPEAEHAIAIILRANPAVSFAAADSTGFILAVDGGATEAAGLLEGHLQLIRETRDRLPAIIVIPSLEFGRLVTVDLELRTRLARAVALKGSLPRGSRLAARLRPVSQSGS
jgi:hypothetical protein